MTKNPLLTWYCIYSQPKHEHIAAAHLRKMQGVEIFLPRIRFKRISRQKTSWVTEALFPGYLFARFNWETSSRQVKYARGVRGIIHFGQHRPAIPESIIQELWLTFGRVELRTIDPELSPGDAVHIANGTLRGLQAIVSHVMPGRDRIAVLMELLGRQTVVELTTDSVIKDGNERATIFRNPRSDDL